MCQIRYRRIVVAERCRGFNNHKFHRLAVFYDNSNRIICVLQEETVRTTIENASGDFCSIVPKHKTVIAIIPIDGYTVFIDK